MVFVKHYYMRWNGVIGYDDFKDYWTPNLYQCFIYTILSTYLMMYPTIVSNSGINLKIYWWAIFFVGMIFGSFYNVQQERFFKKHGVTELLDYIIYLFWETLYLCIWGYIFTPLNFIPGYGYTTPENASCNYLHTFKQSFTTAAFGYNAMFNIGYYFAFIASCYINKEDALIGTATMLITNALIIIISYPIDKLTPDRSVVEIGLLPVTFFLGSMATVMYALWSEQKRKLYEVETGDDTGDVNQKLLGE
jgi:hypothetical protein